MAPIDEPRDPWTPLGTADFDAQPNQGSLRRVAPLLGNNRGWIDLFSSLVFSLPGAPIVYYGDEIGMGDSTYLGGRNRISTPMQWSRDRNAGFSEGDPSRLFLPPVMAPEYHHDVVNVEAQQQRSESLLSSAKRLIAQRKRLRALSRGGTQLLFPEGPGTLAFVRQHEQERVLVVANLSRSVQAVELDLSSFIGRTPVDVFGGARFPPVGASPYFLSLGPSSFYWLALETAATGA